MIFESNDDEDIPDTKEARSDDEDEPGVEADIIDGVQLTNGGAQQADDYTVYIGSCPTSPMNRRMQNQETCKWFFEFRGARLSI